MSNSCVNVLSDQPGRSPLVKINNTLLPGIREKEIYGKKFIISDEYSYSTTPKSKSISVGAYDPKTGGAKTIKYLPKTKENLKAIMRVSGKPDVFNDKSMGKD